MIIAMVPMMLSMGVVEWRAFGFADRARALMCRSLDRRSFARRVRRRLARELALVLAVVFALAAVLVGFLQSRDSLTPQAGFMAGAGVLLAGVFFLGFVVSTTGRYGRLCAALAVCLAGRLMVEATIGRPLSAVEDTSVFLGGTAVLLVLFLLGLCGWVSQPWSHK
jgi:hypothetical protein